MDHLFSLFTDEETETQERRKTKSPEVSHRDTQITSSPELGPMFSVAQTPELSVAQPPPAHTLTSFITTQPHNRQISFP